VFDALSNLPLLDKIFSCFSHVFVSSQNDRLERTPLHWAITNNKTSCIGLLVRNGASVFTTTADGDTVLHLAIEEESTELLEFFIEHAKTAGDVQTLFTTANAEGKTPSDIAKTKDAKRKLLSSLQKSGDKTAGSSMCTIM
jgi:ankyrin repeat protein